MVDEESPHRLHCDLHDAWAPPMTGLVWAGDDRSHALLQSCISSDRLTSPNFGHRFAGAYAADGETLAEALLPGSQRSASDSEDVDSTAPGHRVDNTVNMRAAA
jgi:hypothetical protein